MAVFIKAKKALIQRSAFSKLLTNLVKLSVISFALAHTKITKEVVAYALMTQATIKVFSLNKINFQIFQMI